VSAASQHTATSHARRTRLFGSMCALVFLVNFGRVAFAPLLEPFMATFGVGEATAGLLATLAWLGSALPRLPTGYLLTRVPRHRVVIGTGGLLAVAAAFTAFSPGIVAVGVGAFAIGVSSGVYFIAANPLVTELFPERVGRVLGVHGTASQLAAAIAPLLIAGVLVVASWRWVFGGVVVAAVAVTGVMLVTARAADLPTAGRADRHLLRAVRREWRIIAVAVAVLATVGFVWNGLFNFYISYLTATKGVSAGAASTLLTAVFAAGVPAFWLTGRLADRVPHVPLVLGVAGGFAATLAALTAVRSFAALAAVSLVMGYFVHSLFVATDTYLLSTLPDENRASAYSAYSATMMLVQAFGSAALGTLVEAGWAYDTAFRLGAAGLVVVLALVGGLYWLGRLPGE
jgi:MFS family permease